VKRLHASLLLIVLVARCAAPTTRPIAYFFHDDLRLAHVPRALVRGRGGGPRLPVAHAKACARCSSAVSSSTTGSGGGTTRCSDAISSDGISRLVAQNWTFLERCRLGRPRTREKLVRLIRSGFRLIRACARTRHDAKWPRTHMTAIRELKVIGF
jgi:hypothetical protein